MWPARLRDLEERKEAATTEERNSASKWPIFVRIVVVPHVLTPEDLPALQTYEQQLLERIQIGVQANNSYWIEINQKNLEECVRPAIAMLKQGQTVAKGEKYEREYTPEEWEQRQQHNQEEAYE